VTTFADDLLAEFREFADTAQRRRPALILGQAGVPFMALLQGAAQDLEEQLADHLANDFIVCGFLAYSMRDGRLLVTVQPRRALADDERIEEALRTALAGAFRELYGPPGEGGLWNWADEGPAPF
jgi:hypothetical protein